MKNSHLDRRTQYSLMRIRTALFELLAVKELDAVTVTDICRVADINRGTFYRYYRDVADLFTQIENAFSEDIKQTIGEFTPSADNLNGGLNKCMVILSENKDLIRVIQKGGDNGRAVKNILSFVRPLLIPVVKASTADIDEQTAEYIFEYILGGASNMITKWINDEMTFPLESLQRLLNSLINTSMRSEIDIAGKQLQ